MEVIIPQIESNQKVSISGVPGQGIPLDVFMIRPKYGENDLLPTENLID